MSSKTESATRLLNPFPTPIFFHILTLSVSSPCREGGAKKVEHTKMKCAPLGGCMSDAPLLDTWYATTVLLIVYRCTWYQVPTRPEAYALT